MTRCNEQHEMYSWLQDMITGTTNREAAKARGLIRNVDEIDHILQEYLSSTTSLSKQCELFALILVWHDVGDARDLWKTTGKKSSRKTRSFGLPSKGNTAGDTHGQTYPLFRGQLRSQMHSQLHSQPSKFTALATAPFRGPWKIIESLVKITLDKKSNFQNDDQ